MSRFAVLASLIILPSAICCSNNSLGKVYNGQRNHTLGLSGWWAALKSVLLRTS